MGAQMSKEQGHLHFGYCLEQDTLVEEIKEKEDAGGHSPSDARPGSTTGDDEQLLASLIAVFEDGRPPFSVATSAHPHLHPTTTLNTAGNNLNSAPTQPSDLPIGASNNHLHVTWNADTLLDLVSDEGSDDEDDHENATGFASIYGQLDIADDMNDRSPDDRYTQWMPTDALSLDTSPELITDKILADNSTDKCHENPTDQQNNTAENEKDSQRPSMASARPSMSKSPTQLKPLTFDQLPSTGALIGLCGARLRRLSPNIGLLQSLVCLQLCCNQLRSLPPEIGHLTGLRTLDLSGNQLRRLPETIGHLTQLTVLRVSRNRLQALPRSIGRLERLERLAIDRNRLTQLPSEIGQLKRLGWMDVRWNTELSALPAELIRLAFLRRLRTTGCPLQRRRISHRERAADDGTLFAFEPIILAGGDIPPPLAPETSSRTRTRTTSAPVVGDGATEGISDVPQPVLPVDPTGPPSLRELAARTIIRHQMPLPANLPASLKRYLSSATRCTECNGPFFEHTHRRRRLFMKQYREIWLEYQLCSPHWATDRERIACLFGELPPTAMSYDQNDNTSYDKSTDRQRQRHANNTLRQTTAMHNNDNVDPNGVDGGTFSGLPSQRRRSTLMNIATRTMGRSSTIRRMSLLMSDHGSDSKQQQQQQQKQVETVPLALLFTPPPAPAISIAQLEQKTTTKSTRPSLSIKRTRGNTRPTAMSIIGMNNNNVNGNVANISNGNGNSVPMDTTLSNATFESITAAATSTMTTDSSATSGNPATSMAMASGSNLAVGPTHLLTTIATARTALANFNDAAFSPPNSPGAESILSAHELDVDPDAIDVLISSDNNDRLMSAASSGLLISSPSSTSILSGHGHFTLSPPPSSSSQIDGTSSLSDGTTTIGRKTTLVGSIRRRLGARSRPSARSLRRAFVSDQTN